MSKRDRDDLMMAKARLEKVLREVTERECRQAAAPALYPRVIEAVRDHVDKRIRMAVRNAIEPTN